MVLSLLVSLRFQVLFHSPPGVLFTFPSRYYSLSVTWSYLAFWDGPHFFRLDFSCPDVLRIPLGSLNVSSTGLSPSLINLSRLFDYASLCLSCGPYPTGITPLVWAAPISLASTLGITFCFLFLRVLRCFSSPGSPHIPIYSVYDNTVLAVLSSLIRISTVRWIFAPHRSFSQIVTSFFGATYQGILRKPFVAWSSLFLLVFSIFLKILYSYSANFFLIAASRALKLLLTSFAFINQISFLSLIWKFILPFVLVFHYS